MPSSDMPASKDIEYNKQSTKEEKLYKFKAGAFLTGMTAISFIGGFGMSLGQAKKKDTKMFSKGMVGARDLHEAGSALALRALGWGTVYAVSGFSIFCFTVWKIMGVNNLTEFRNKVGNFLPRIPKKESEGRTEFSGLNDLLQYLIDEDERQKKLKAPKIIDNTIK